MNHASIRPGLLAIALLAAGILPAPAAVPPDRMNYQGVLRNAADAPQGGPFDMIFRFFSAASGGDEILVDRHLASGTGAVTVSGGLFSVALGSGAVSDGAGPGSYTTLGAMFRDYQTVHLEVQVGSETLSPRTRVASSAYALNADHLDGLDSTGFGRVNSVNSWTAANTFSSASNSFTGSGSGLTSLNAGNLSSGTVADARLSSNVALKSAANTWTGASTFTRTPVGSLVDGGSLTVNPASASANFTILGAAVAGVEKLKLDAEGDLTMAGNLTASGWLWSKASGIYSDSPTPALYLRDATGSTSLTALYASDASNLTYIYDYQNARYPFYSDASGIGIGTSVPTSGYTATTPSLNVTGNSLLGGTLETGGMARFKGNGAEIYGSSPSLRFYDAAGTILTQLSTSDASNFNWFYDYQNSQYVTYSDADGIGIGTSFTDTGYTLTTPSLRVFSGAAALNKTLYMDSDGADGSQFIYFYNFGSATGESFSFDDAEDRFELTDDLMLSGTLRVANTGAPVGYNSISTPLSEASDVCCTNDLFVSDDIEVGGDLFLSRFLFMEGDNDGTTSEADQYIYFFNSGSRTARAFRWEDTNDRFSVNDDLRVYGELIANVKPFVQNHPEREDLEIRYVALEGDEAANFTRGHARLRGGEARVALGETFAWVTNPEVGLTAHLTPRGSGALLYVESLTPRELVVRASPGSPPDAAFDYLVMGLRAGYERYATVRPRTGDAPVPSDAYYDRFYSENPGLRPFSALDRHAASGAARTAGEDGGGAIAKTEAARALRAAIGTYDPDLDPRGPAPEVHADEREPAGLADDVRGGQTQVATGAAPARGTGSADAVAAGAGRPDAGSPAPALPVDAEGNVYARSFRPSAGDLASLVAVSESVEAGDVLVIDPRRPGVMRLSSSASDPAVFGIVAADPGVVLGAGGVEAAGETAPGEAPVALSGIVLCKADAGYGSILPGDLLATSATPGHAMRADDPRPGAVIGKALEPLEAGTGLIRVLVTLR